MAISMAMFCAVLPDLFPGSVISQRAVADPWFKAHFIVATFAVGFFSLAAMLAVLMNVQDRALRKGMANGMAGSPTWVESLPPLLTMESFLFRLLYVGYVLLTLTVFSGLFFSQELFGKPLVFDHKTVFALLSWALFTGLVVARIRVGLRGPSAVRWVLGGFLALLLTYAGTRFVAEVIFAASIALLKWALLGLGLGLAYWWLIAKKKSKAQTADKKIRQGRNPLNELPADDLVFILRSPPP